MIEDCEWIKRQQTKSEIKENYECLQKVKANADDKLDEYFEYVVDRLFMAIGGFKKIEAYIILDTEMKPDRVADGNDLKTFGRDCFVSYDEFDLVVEVTRRPLYDTALHWSHLEKELKVTQSGIIVFLDIVKVDANLWVQNKAQFDVEEIFFHLCDADFLFKLLKDQPAAFTKFQEFLKESEKIWREEKDYETIQKKIITLVKQENTA